MRGYTAWDTLDPDAVVLRHERPHGTVTVYRRSSTYGTATGTGSFRNCIVCVDRQAKSSFGDKQSKDEHDTSIRNYCVYDLGHECDYWKVNQQLLRKKSRKRLHSAPATTSSESLKIHSHIDTEALVQHSFRKVCADKTRHLIYGKAEEREDPSAAQMKEAYESLLKREQAYVKDDLELFLEYNDMTEFRKKEILHKKWAEQVAEPIRREIDQQMHSRRLPALERRRQQLYDDYLTHVNKKGHVFLDIIAPDEYYALGLQDIQPFLLKAKTKRLRDPTLAQYRARNDEDRVELRCLSGSFLTDKDIEQIRLPPVPLVPLGREGVNATSWVRMPLADIDSTDRRASR
ncbi:hypothetical protein LSAT2_006594 [Lamellibrachia satsuma]|nr:hypothetical protein LSAT2_006594 [Lamellibrachia satsuma]